MNFINFYSLKKLNEPLNYFMINSKLSEFRFE